MSAVAGSFEATLHLAWCGGIQIEKHIAIRKP
jgi:hypothetical protein